MGNPCVSWAFLYSTVSIYVCLFLVNYCICCIVLYLCCYFCILGISSISLYAFALWFLLLSAVHEANKDIYYCLLRNQMMMRRYHLKTVQSSSKLVVVKMMQRKLIRQMKRLVSSTGMGYSNLYQ